MGRKYDLHLHLFSNWGRGRFSLEWASREPGDVLDAIRAAGLDGIVLTNFGEKGTWSHAFEEFADSVSEASMGERYRLVRRLSNALVFADAEGEIEVMRGQEIPVRMEETGREAHIMMIGSDEGVIVPSRLELGEALRAAGKTGAVRSADHYNGFLGIGRENLVKYREDFDCFEGANQNFAQPLLRPKLGLNPSVEEADALAAETGLHWIAVSDCHNRRDAGNGHIVFGEGVAMDTSSADALRESLREILAGGKFRPVLRAPNPLSSILGHVLIAQYDIRIRNPLGWTDLESY